MKFAVLCIRGSFIIIIEVTDKKSGQAFQRLSAPRRRLCSHYRSSPLTLYHKSGGFVKWLWLLFCRKAGFMANYIAYEKGEPAGVIPPLLAEHFKANEHYYLIKSGKVCGEKPMIALYNSTRGVFEIVGKTKLEAEIKKYIHSVKVELIKMRDVEEVYKQLTADRDNLWITLEAMNSAQNIINFKNGLLDLKTMSFSDHTPKVLSSIQLDTDYDPDYNTAENGCPVFKNYLATLTNGDDEVIKLLWEYLGLVISNIHGYVTKQALFLVGIGDTGKSQYLALLAELVGRDNYASIDLKGLEERFGTAAIFDKRLAGCPDMSFMDIGELKVFKKITGGDAIQFEHKGRDAITARYQGCLIFCANSMPKFSGDKGDHVYNRMLCVPCVNVIPPEKRDPELLSKMLSEKQAIINTAIVHLRDFITRGYKFDEPKVCQSFRKEYKVANDNVLQFLNECCAPREQVGHQAVSTRFEFYNAYKAYCAENNVRAVNKTEFYARLESNGVNTNCRSSSCRFCDWELRGDAFEHYNTKP